MVIIKLWGGLGNQLFQYAYGYQLAKKINSKILLDTSWFDKQSLRQPEILNLPIKFVSAERAVFQNNTINLLNRRFLNILIRFPSYACYKIKGGYYLKESRYKFSEKLNHFNYDNTYIDGYWQCPKYFDWIKNELEKMYIPLNIRPEVEALAIKLKNINSVAIHVRRGDYSKNKKWYSRLKIIDNEYYFRAISLMDKLNKNAKYYLFSNDIKDAQQTLNYIVNKEINQPHIANLTSIEEWYLMYNCKNQIIGNSTFSWWAAYLNNYAQKIVIAPNNYMGNDDIIPETWRTINIK